MIIPPELNKNLTYYLSGPMTGYPDFNYASFESSLQTLTREGIDIESPHRSSLPPVALYNEQLWVYMMRKALAKLLVCDGIILKEGWASSKGSVLEYQIATEFGFPAYFIIGDVVSLTAKNG